MTKNSMLEMAMAAGVKAFEDRFGRRPTDDDPLLWEIDEPGDNPVPTPQQKMCDQTLDAMIKAGIPHSLIWGFLITGFMLSEDAYKSLGRKEKKEWDAATKITSDLSPFVRAARERLAWNCYPGLTHFTERRG